MIPYNFDLKAEVRCLGQYRHPNLVKLIGYCCEKKHRMLVYEYMPRGSLENHLFMKSKLIHFFHIVLLILGLIMSEC